MGLIRARVSCHVGLVDWFCMVTLLKMLIKETQGKTLEAPKAFPVVSDVIPSASYAVLCGVRGRDNKRVSSSRYPQRYCSGVSIKGIEVRCLMPFCVFVPDEIDGIEGCEAHPHNTQTIRLLDYDLHKDLNSCE